MYMFKYILKRIGLMLFTFSVIMLICFVLIKSLPIPLNDGLGKDKELLEANLRARGYYDPIMVQLGRYLERIFTKGRLRHWYDNGPGLINKPVWDSFIKACPHNTYKCLLVYYRCADRSGAWNFCRAEKE